MVSGTILLQGDQDAFLADQLGADAYVEVSSTTGHGIEKLLDEAISKPVVKGRNSSVSLFKIPHSMNYMFSAQGTYSPPISPNAPHTGVSWLSFRGIWWQ